MSENIGSKIIRFNRELQYDADLPAGYQVMNPFGNNPETMQVMEAFYTRFYADHHPRRFLIGINPSRHGAGVTGVPFTDTKRLESDCGIRMETARTHEVSSVFMYDMIRAYGGTAMFYKDFYINSPFPLAIIRRTKSGNWVNANYYDDRQLFELVKPFMIQSLKAHISIGIHTDKVYILGKKNARFLEKLNQNERLFDQMIVLEHPRYIQQYQSKNKDFYIQKYVEALRS